VSMALCANQTARSAIIDPMRYSMQHFPERFRSQKSNMNIITTNKMT
jgi:hypothetical protein